MSSNNTSNTLVLPGKKGVCFTLRQEGDPQGGTWMENLPKILATDAYWCYSWGFDSLTYQLMQEKCPSLVWIPMSWGGSTVENLQQRITESKTWIQTVPLFLGFNEPDQKDQSNMSIECVLNLWPTLESLNVPLASPACAQPGGKWMEDFMRQAKATGKRIDYIAVHWYGGCNVTAFQTKMMEYYQKYDQRPLIITEFAPADWSSRDINHNKISKQHCLDFMKQALPWLEQTEWIIGYSWFSFQQSSPQGCNAALFDKKGQLTPLGQFYKSVRSDNIYGDQTIHY